MSVIETKPRIALAVLTAVSVGLIIGCYLTPSMSFAQTDFSIPDLSPVPHDHKETEENKRLREQVIKDNAKKNIRDAAELLKLATDLNAQMTKDGGVQYIPAQAANETKRIEKLAKDIRGRLNQDVRDIHF